MRETTPFTKTEEKIIGEKLERNLGPEYLSTRSGPSGRLTYIEGQTAISIANEIFGFNGWSSEIKETTVDFCDKTLEGKFNTGISVTIRITLKDGTFHDDIGYGASENARSKAAAFEKAKKQAVTDATKRALRNFGNALGNCLYDKNYVNNITKMANPTIKFTPQNLYRHIQFDTKRKEQMLIEERESKHRKLNEQHRHEQQISLQSQKLSQSLSPPPPSRKAYPPESSAKSNLETMKITTVKAESSVQSKVTAKPEPVQSKTTSVKSEFIPPLLMPEDSFSYEGDDEFFVQMLAGEESEPVGNGFQSQDSANLVTHN